MYTVKKIETPDRGELFAVVNGDSDTEIISRYTTEEEAKESCTLLNGGEAAENQTYCKTFELIEHPAAKRLVGESIATLDQESAVEAQWQADRLVDERQQRHICRNGERRMRNCSPRDGLRQVSQTDAAAGEEKAAEEDGAPDEREQPGGALQAVISAGFVLVHATLEFWDARECCR